LSKATFQVMGVLDSAGGARSGTVVIDRETGLFEVRRLHARRTYVLSLSFVADMVVQRLLRLEAAEKAAGKKAKKGKPKSAKPRKEKGNGKGKVEEKGRDDGEGLPGVFPRIANSEA